jgi:PIN domain nuclease of toxin-antitoxin system
MKLLLDTHIIIWSAGAPERLSPSMAEALEDQKNELWYSPISVWETLLLAEKGRLGKVDSNRRRFVERLFDSLREAALNTHVALASRSLKTNHADPADRFIAATAQVYDLTLVTADDQLLKISELRTFR